MSLFAYYDTVSDKIVNCTEGSFAWWHERGHQVYAKRESKWFELVVAPWLLFGSIVLLVTENNFYAGIAIFGCIGIFLADEAFAWWYCFTHFKEWRRA